MRISLVTAYSKSCGNCLQDHPLNDRIQMDNDGYILLYIFYYIYMLYYIYVILYILDKTYIYNYILLFLYMSLYIYYCIYIIVYIYYYSYIYIIMYYYIYILLCIIYSKQGQNSSKMLSPSKQDVGGMDFQSPRLQCWTLHPIMAFIRD